MPAEMHWVNKSASSHSLSHSTNKAEETHIRRQAQKRKVIERPSLIAYPTRSRQLNDTNKIHEVHRHGRPLSFADAVTQKAIRIANQPALVRQIDLTPHRTGHERRGLDLFFHHTAHVWSGWQDAHFWLETAMILAQQHAVVAHSLIALSALHESLELSQHDERRRHELHEICLQQRQKAIVMASTSCSNHVVALVSCLALLCLQNLLHAHHSFRLLQAGAKLLVEYERSNSGVDRRSNIDHQHVAKHIRPIFDRLKWRLAIMLDPSKAFEISVTARLSQPVQPLDDTPSVPLGFTSLRHARNCLEDILKWAQGLLGFVASNRLPQKFRPSLCRWFEAVDNVSTPVYDKDFKRNSNLLKIAAHFGMILILTFRAANETVYDGYTSTFLEMVVLIEETNERTDDVSNHSFGIDDGLIDIVAFVGQRCRDPHVRRRALCILLDSRRLDGHRLAHTAGLILQTFIDLEEMGLSDVRSATEVPEENRIRLLSGSQYFTLRKLKIIFVRSPYDGHAGAEQVEIWLDMPSELHAVDPDHGLVIRISSSFTSTEGAYSAFEDGQTNSPLCYPDTVIGGGFVSFLDDATNGQYYVVDSGPFFFPIPRA